MKNNKVFFLKLRVHRKNLEAKMIIKLNPNNLIYIQQLRMVQTWRKNLLKQKLILSNQMTFKNKKELFCAILMAAIHMHLDQVRKMCGYKSAKMNQMVPVMQQTNNKYSISKMKSTFC